MMWLGWIRRREAAIVDWIAATPYRTACMLQDTGLAIFLIAFVFGPLAVPWLVFSAALGGLLIANLSNTIVCPVCRKSLIRIAIDGKPELWWAPRRIHGPERICSQCGTILDKPAKSHCP